MLYQGWSPRISEKVCIRCGGSNDNELYRLCDDCREDDEREAGAYYIEHAQREQERADEQALVHLARYGY